MKAESERNDQLVGRPTPHVTARRVPTAPTRSVAGQLSDLCQRLARLRRTREIRSVLITSALPREGKTAMAVHLAAALAKLWPRVLLVDADLRQAGVASTL